MKNKITKTRNLFFLAVIILTASCSKPALGKDCPSCTPNYNPGATFLPTANWAPRQIYFPYGVAGSMAYPIGGYDSNNNPYAAFYAPNNPAINMNMRSCWASYIDESGQHDVWVMFDKDMIDLFNQYPAGQYNNTGWIATISSYPLGYAGATINKVNQIPYLVGSPVLQPIAVFVETQARRL